MAFRGFRGAYRLYKSLRGRSQQDKPSGKEGSHVERLKGERDAQLAEKTPLTPAEVEENMQQAQKLSEQPYVAQDAEELTSVASPGMQKVFDALPEEVQDAAVEAGLDILRARQSIVERYAEQASQSPQPEVEYEQGFEQED